MNYDDLKVFLVNIQDRVARVTINNPPINLLDRKMRPEMDDLSKRLEIDDSVSVVIFESAIPDFFMAHGDTSEIFERPQVLRPKSSGLRLQHAVHERFRTMPKVTMAIVKGRVGGGGNEFLLSLDMVFASRTRARFSQPEVSVGLIPGNSGTQRLPEKMGRARALEFILGCSEFSAEQAEQYGMINRCLEENEIDTFVNSLARKIASFPLKAIQSAKQAVDNANIMTVNGLIEEGWLYDQCLNDPECRGRLKKFVDSGGQDPKNEMRLHDFIIELYK